jgi:hypothetical protein
MQISDRPTPLGETTTCTRVRATCELLTTVTTMKMSRNTSNREQLIEDTLHLVDEGVYDSIRQATRATGTTLTYVTGGFRRESDSEG